MNTNVAVARTIALPSYIFISLLLGMLGIAATRVVWQGGESGLAILIFALFVVYIGMYWLRYVQGNKGTRWWFYYYPVQTILMASLVFLLRNHQSIGTSFIYSATICIVGESLGTWGNSRRAFLIGAFYVALLAALLFIFTDREQFYSAISGLVVNGGAIILFIVMINQQLIERQKAVDLAETLEAANAKLAASAAKIESLTLQNERQRMARELHDTLAQGVAGHVLQLEAIKAHLAANRTERASAIVEQAIVRARTTLVESRAAIDNLRAMPSDIREAVHQTVERFKQSAGIPCELEISMSENQLSDETTNHALNILSESLTNILRHAQATQVHVKFIIQKQTLELEVTDNGKGFDVNEQASGHYGLVGMHERARLTGGTLSVESNASGTCVQFAVGRP